MMGSISPNIYPTIPRRNNNNNNDNNNGSNNDGNNNNNGTATTTRTTAAAATTTTATQQQPTEKLANNLFSKNESKERNVKKSFVAKIEKQFQSLLLFHWFFVFSIFYSIQFEFVEKEK